MNPAPRLLVLGGTHFVGRAVVDTALDAGWDVTTLHRGRSPEPLPAGVHQVLGDRTDPGTLDSLVTGHPGGWDAVVDTWSADPWVVRDAARALGDLVGRYVYVSSRSVYDEPSAGADESWPLVAADPGAHDVDYAAAKAGGERAVTDVFGDRAVLLRPGVILGPREDVGRLPWWLGRTARGGDVLAPGPRDAGIQVIDARDLAAFALRCVGGSSVGGAGGESLGRPDLAVPPLAGAYDVVSPVGHATMGDLLDACVAATGSGARLHWVEPQTILDAGIAPWTELPIWLPPGDVHDALHGADVSRALAAGLVCRPLAETVADTWAWLASIGGRAAQRPDRPPLGLDPDVEAGVLATPDGARPACTRGTHPNREVPGATAR